MRAGVPTILALTLLTACSPGDRGPEPAAEVPAADEPPVVPEEPLPAPQYDRGRPFELRVTGDEYRWRLRYPGPDGELDTADDLLTWRHVHLPADAEIVIDLESVDYVYTFYVPELDLMEPAVPGSPYALDFESGPPAVHDLLGSQMCGYTHPQLLGDVVIHPAEEFDRWLAGLRSP
jgi:heme/copper-type cytochrome/quinol oxidase subunit 2